LIDMSTYRLLLQL